jgi:hypothetical protein
MPLYNGDVLNSRWKTLDNYTLLGRWPGEKQFLKSIDKEE